MQTNSYPVLCLSAIVSLAAITGCHHDHHESRDEVVLYDNDHHFEHHGYYDDRHDWHGGYYDERHEFHNDPRDFHGDRR